MITVSAHLNVGRPLTTSQYQKELAKPFRSFVAQVGEDALVGTFGDLKSEIFKSGERFEAFKRRARMLGRSKPSVDNDRRSNGYLDFTLELASAGFSDTNCGLQKLIHILASDLFLREAPGIDGRTRVDNVDLADLRPAFQADFGRRSHDIDSIRKAFALAADEPLLAFSMKPRSGLEPADYCWMTEQALLGGFHLVELDTRDMAFGPDRTELFRQLARTALDVGKRLGRPVRFSPNLSGPYEIIRPALDAMSAVHGEAGAEAWVVKIDGDLDGLSTMQAVRRATHLHAQPIITCYPLLKYALAPFVGADSFVEMLVMSGADIIYPGGRPRFDPEQSSIDGQELDRARRHYERIVRDGRPLPSVAGGTLIGQVHANIALLGTDIAFFVGGGLALSRKGLREAAEAFCGAVREARRLQRESEWSASKISRTFAGLLDVYRDEKGDVPSHLDYVRVADLLGEADFACGDKEIGK